jgi:hypothetical protein
MHIMVVQPFQWDSQCLIYWIQGLFLHTPYSSLASIQCMQCSFQKHQNHHHNEKNMKLKKYCLPQFPILDRVRGIYFLSLHHFATLLEPLMWLVNEFTISDSLLLHLATSSSTRHSPLKFSS